MGATAVGTVAGIAGLALQGVQHSEYLKQLPEQNRLLDLQVKIAQRQLRQYEETEKQEAMFKAPANIPMRPLVPPSSITTRSMSQIGNLGTQLTPMRNGVGFRNPAYEPPITNVRPPTPLSNKDSTGRFNLSWIY